MCLQMQANDIGSELFGKAKDAKAKTAWAEEGEPSRLDKWLAHLDRVYQKSDEPYLLGSSLTTADFALLPTLEALDWYRSIYLCSAC